jgi:hypothetical protein
MLLRVWQRLHRHCESGTDSPRALAQASTHPSAHFADLTGPSAAALCASVSWAIA